MHLRFDRSACTARFISCRRRLALRGSLVIAQSGYLDVPRSLFYTLRGAAGKTPPLHGKVALVTGASRGAFSLRPA